MRDLWNKDQEFKFFSKYLNEYRPEQLFYKSQENKYYAYWPKAYENEKDTLQSRNSWVGKYTGTWATDLLQDFAENHGLYAIEGAVCPELELSKRSSADVAICKKKTKNQLADDIVLIFEVKMSVVWNWELTFKGSERILTCIGDYTSHSGNPSLLRSDSVLKAIGKGLNIRISCPKASKIPIVILGNTPITDHYFTKVDQLRKTGIIQGFWSLNPKPRCEQKGNDLKSTKGLGFKRLDSYEEMAIDLDLLLKEERQFFSSMQTKNDLGKMIELANKEVNYEKKAEKFLKLLSE